MPQPRERPAAVATDAWPVVALGTVLFFLAFIALLVSHSWLGEHHHRIWLWTALAGWLLGLAGLILVRRHRRAGRTR